MYRCPLKGRGRPESVQLLAVSCTDPSQREILSFPAIAEADEVHEIETIWGPQCFARMRSRVASGSRSGCSGDPATISGTTSAGSALSSPGGSPHRAELGHRQQGDRAQQF
jgi:hypothetical protein